MSAPPQPLTAKERDLLVLVARGLSNANIARKLNLSEQTVKSHLQHIGTKLGARRRAAMVRAACAAGALAPKPPRGPAPVLTLEERFLLRRAGNGASLREISRELCVSYGTAKARARDLCSTLRAVNLPQAVGHASGWGLLSAD
ncbi:LuxR C-terminal-related transcriptional regulator [Streptomyces sp. NPDC018045]|uniref:LuxR C-terminal-related transcriptional regulator n=1 Tax=Streptomyces sp. NPDC018045 TaxID=3365037 RepID=UPI00379E70F8